MGKAMTLGASIKLACAALTLAVSASALATQRSGADAVVAYPEGYRGWTHVKSGVIGPGHKNFASSGGFQHIYANAEAMAGYRTRVFPEGSIVAFDWLEMREEAGAFIEGPRRQVDVMVKDSQRFAATGGWGFQRFAKDTRERAAAPTPEQCFACHNSLKKDGLILGSYRP